MTTNDPNVVNGDNGVYDDGMTLNARCRVVAADGDAIGGGIRGSIQRELSLHQRQRHLGTDYVVVSVL